MALKLLLPLMQLRDNSYISWTMRRKNNIEIAGIYLDVGYHGRTMDRPGLQAVIQTLKEGNADVILVANYNRLYRGRFPKELQELPVVSLKEQNRKRA